MLRLNLLFAGLFTTDFCYIYMSVFVASACMHVCLRVHACARGMRVNAEEKKTLNELHLPLVLLRLNLLLFSSSVLLRFLMATLPGERLDAER